MAMLIQTFFGQFKQVKAYLDSTPDATAELKTAFAATAAAFKAAYSADAFKQALAENQTVGTDLEERITSTFILLNRERARKT